MEISTVKNLVENIGIEKANGMEIYVFNFLNNPNRIHRVVYRNTEPIKVRLSVSESQFGSLQISFYNTNTDNYIRNLHREMFMAYTREEAIEKYNSLIDGRILLWEQELQKERNRLEKLKNKVENNLE